RAPRRSSLAEPRRKCRRRGARWQVFLKTAFRALRAVAENRDLRRAEAAFALFIAVEHGTWVAILVYAYLRGGSGEAGIAAFVQLAPAALLAPLAGAAADRLGGVRMLTVGYALQTLTMASTAVALALAAPPWLVYAVAATAAVSVTM